MCRTVLVKAKSHSADVGDVDSSSSSALVKSQPSLPLPPQGYSGYCGESPDNPNDVFQHCVYTHVMQWEAGSYFHGKRPALTAQQPMLAAFSLETLVFD